MVQRKLQTRKNKSLDAGFDITKEAKKRAVECDDVIDCNKRKYFGHEPKMSD